MSLSSLAEKFRSQFPAIDQHYREQEQVQAEAQLAQAALLAQQESALVQASVDRWQATH